MVACGGSGSEPPPSRTLDSIVVSPSSIALTQQATTQLTIRGVDSVGNEIPDIPVQFNVSDASVITVSGNGLVTSVGPRGTGAVSIRSGSHSTVVPYTVTPVPTSLVVAPNPAVVGPNGSV